MWFGMPTLIFPLEHKTLPTFEPTDFYQITLKTDFLIISHDNQDLQRSKTRPSWSWKQPKIESVGP